MINLLCDRALTLGAQAGANTITAGPIDEAAQTLALKRPAAAEPAWYKRLPRWVPGAAGAVASSPCSGSACPGIGWSRSQCRPSPRRRAARSLRPCSRTRSRRKNSPARPPRRAAARSWIRSSRIRRKARCSEVQVPGSRFVFTVRVPVRDFGVPVFGVPAVVAADVFRGGVFCGRVFLPPWLPSPRPSWPTRAWSSGAAATPWRRSRPRRFSSNCALTSCCCARCASSSCSLR